MFQVGQQVQCIDDRFNSKDRYWVPNLPVVDCVYTIKEMVPGHRGMGLRLCELKNPLIPIDCDNRTRTIQFEPTFHVCRFRPLIERKTDISIFTEMLNKQPSELVG